MITSQTSLLIKTSGRSLINITVNIGDVLSQLSIETGLCNLFLHHTSASLILCENYDPVVQEDLESFMQHLVRDGDKLFKHTEEGPDDMPSHIRTILTQSSLTIPISNNKLNLGKWQGIYLWEHRWQKHERKLTITIQGS